MGTEPNRLSKTVRWVNCHYQCKSFQTDLASWSKCKDKQLVTVCTDQASSMNKWFVEFPLHWSWVMSLKSAGCTFNPACCGSVSHSKLQALMIWWWIVALFGYLFGVKITEENRMQISTTHLACMSEPIVQWVGGKFPLKDQSRCILQVDERNTFVGAAALVLNGLCMSIYDILG